MTDKNEKTFSDADKLKEWLAEQAEENNLEFLLAHDEDGVIWGKFDDGKLTIAADVFKETAEVQTKLRVETLRQARLFGQDNEILLWRIEDGFKYILLNEDEIEEDVLEENYWLWGEGEKADERGFTLMVDGRQGLRHAPPVEAVRKRAALLVKHHLDYDEKGQAYIARSRLAGLEIVKEGKNGA